MTGHLHWQAAFSTQKGRPVKTGCTVRLQPLTHLYRHVQYVLVGEYISLSVSINVAINSLRVSDQSATHGAADREYKT